MCVRYVRISKQRVIPVVLTVKLVSAAWCGNYPALTAFFILSEHYSSLSNCALLITCARLVITVICEVRGASAMLRSLSLVIMK